MGGHSIRDDELKFGYAVTGLIDPRKIWKNIGARPGDVLILTKAIGTGVIATGLKQGKIGDEPVRAATESMTRLNRAAAEALHELITAAGVDAAPVHAVTDVTGFGLLGHAREMAIGSGVSLRLEHGRVEYLPGAIEAARAGFLSGGLRNNQAFLEGCVHFAGGVSEDYRNLFFDPQTSGGLLVAVEKEYVDAAVQGLGRHGVRGSVIGGVVEKSSPLIEVV